MEAAGSELNAGLDRTDDCRACRETYEERNEQLEREARRGLCLSDSTVKNNLPRKGRNDGVGVTAGRATGPKPVGRLPHDDSVKQNEVG